MKVQSSKMSFLQPFEKVFVDSTSAAGLSWEVVSVYSY